MVKLVRLQNSPLSVRASEIERRPVRRVSTGREAWDRALAGGIVCPSSALLFGAAGIGKTTMALAVATKIAEGLGGDALYGSAEMRQEMVVMTADRADADPKRLLIYDGDESEAFVQEIRTHKPRVVVWDSLQAFRRGGELGELAQREVLATAIREGGRCGAVTILLSQVSKAGDYLGSNGFRHGVDATLSLLRDPKGQLVLAVEKHRFGPSPVKVVDSQKIALP